MKTKEQLIKENSELKKRVSKLEKSEKELFENKERYQILVETMNDGLCIINKSGVIAYINNKLSEMMGYSRIEVEGHNAFEFFDQKNQEILREQLLKRTQGKEDPYELSITRKDGNYVHVFLSPKVLINSEGEMVGSFAILTDVTKYKKAEKKLRESEKKFRTLAEHSPNMIFIIKESRLIYVNKVAEKVTGYTKKEFYSPNFDFLNYIHPKDRKLVSDNHKRHLNGRNVKPYEFSIIKKDGKTLDVINLSRLIDYEGVKAILGVVTDISEQKQTEKELIKAKEQLEQQNKELMKLDKAKDRLIRDVSHELKTPVAKYKMSLEMLKKILEDNNLMDDAGNIFDVMKSSAKRQDKVINNILTLSRFEAGAAKYKKEPVDLEEIIISILEQYKSIIKDKEIEVKTNIEKVIIQSDKEMLEHAISNVIDNSIKYLNPNTSSQININLKQKKEEIVIKIADNGIGISKELKEHAFESFYQEEPTYEGSGIGLTISKKIVEDLGGKIWLESPGKSKGATFYIKLPIR